LLRQEAGSANHMLVNIATGRFIHPTKYVQFVKEVNLSDEKCELILPPQEFILSRACNSATIRKLIQSNVKQLRYKVNSSSQM
jgi:hypothetical protein